MPSRKAPRRKVNAARREATQQEKRLYAKQFLEAKHGEIKSLMVTEMLSANFLQKLVIQLIWEQDLKEQHMD